MSSAGSLNEAHAAEVVRLGSTLAQVATARNQDRATLQQLEAWMTQLQVEHPGISDGASRSADLVPSRGGSAQPSRSNEGATMTTANNISVRVSDLREIVGKSLHCAGRYEAQELADRLGQLLADLLLRRADRASDLLMSLHPADVWKKRRAQQEVRDVGAAVMKALDQAMTKLEAAEDHVAGGGGGGGEAQVEAALQQTFQAAMEIVAGVHDMAEIRTKALTRVLVEEVLDGV